MKIILSVLIFVLVYACATPNRKVSSTQPVPDSLATLIIRSELGLPVLVNTNKYMQTLFEGTEDFTSDTLDIPVFQLDLLTVSERSYTRMSNSLPVRPGDSVEVKISPQNIHFFTLNNGKKIPVNWNRTTILPEQESYALIEEMKTTYNHMLMPPPLWNDATETAKKAAKKAYDEYRKKRKNSENLSVIKNNYIRYYDEINHFYEQAFRGTKRIKDSIQRNFNESFIGWEQYQDLKILYHLTKEAVVIEKMKKVCDENIKIKGPFSLPMLNDYFMSRYIWGRQVLPLTEVYDSIIVKQFPYQEKKLKMLVLQEMQMPFVKYSRKDIITYIDKFIAQYGINDPIREMMEKVEYDVEVSSDLLLESLDGEKTSFEKIRKTYPGQVLYIDFWASWCAPCRIALPESKKLQEEFKDKGVIFIYLALNDELKEWRQACEKEQLLTNSFRITNPKSSTFIHKMKLNSIPRYMLYDKDGKLFQGDAAAPGSTAIRSTLKNLLKQE